MAKKGNKSWPVPEPPAHLSDKSKQLWNSILAQKHFTDNNLAMFQAALEAHDRAAEARKEIKDRGMLLTSANGSIHANPCLKVEQDSLTLFVKIFEKLYLHVNIDDELL
jgi:P27 family predicted phage terminase small subunit